MRKALFILLAGSLVLAGTWLAVDAVATIRESAHRAQCAYNIQLITTSLTLYRTTYNTFPAGTVRAPALPPEARLSWLFELDPFIHARMDPDWLRDRNGPWNSPDNLRVAHHVMPFTACPNGTQTTADGLAVTNYVGAAGVGPAAPLLPKADPLAGVFGYDRKVSLADITDGSATTAMVLEVADAGPWLAGGWATVRGLDPADRPYVGRGRPFGGTHAAGMNVGLADGSCRFVRQTVSPGVWDALVTIAGGDDPGPLPDE
jgi:hypothetical protein